MATKPDPRLSEILAAKKLAQSRIAEAIRKEFDEFKATTGLVPEGLTVTVVGHYTNRQELPDDYLVTGVDMQVRY